MKRLKPVNISIDAHMDADDLGARLVECVRSMNTDNNVINIVKIHFGDSLSVNNFDHIVTNMLVKPLREMGADNCIFIPLKKGLIEDVTIEHIEVVKDDPNNKSD